MSPSRFTLAPFALAALMAIGLNGPLFAQATAPGNPVNLSIAAQPLGTALNELARQAGLQLLFPPALVAGKTAPAVSGRLTPRQALDQLLAHSGLVASQEGDAIVVKASPESASSAEKALLPPVQVTARRDAQALPAPYAGGQVARGGRLGLLGNRDVMDTPFNITAYTSELIENQQATTLADVLANDSSVRMEIRGQGTAVGGGDNFLIRGFALGNRDATFNGVYGVVPNGTIAVETIERVEVLKGPSALLNGMAPSGGVGGTINIVPKRASDLPLTRLTTTYSSKTQAGVHLDVGRRFGQENQFGVRVNGIYRDGQTALDHQKSKLTVGTLGLDYRGQRTRFSADIGHQRDVTRQPSAFYTLEPSVTTTPRAPRSRLNVAQPWEKKNFKDDYLLLNGEVDLGSNVTAYAAYGQRKHHHDLFRTENYLIGNDGTFEAYPSAYPESSRTRSYQVGARGTFKTGSVGHAVNVGLSSLQLEAGFGYAFGGATISNIYNPVPVAYPGFPPEPTRKVSETTLDSIALADTLSMLDNQLQLTLGVRSQRVKIDSFSTVTGEKNPSGPGYKQSATTPAAGLLVKVTSGLSLYGNYIEGLSQGDVAPGSAANAGTIFAPRKTKQQEVGLKQDFGSFTTTLSLFQIAQPAAMTVSGNVYTIDGEQRNRGLEFSGFGQLQPGMRLLGGITLLRAELTRTQGGMNDGHDATGIPRWMSNLGAEWDPAFAPGLTFSTRLIATGTEHANVANSFKVPAWFRWDLGSSFKTKALGRPLVLRAGVLNVANRQYWEGVNNVTGLRLAAPRTASLSASVDF